MGKDNMRRVKVAVVSLGCAKNQVDAEQMMARLAAEGYAFVEEPGVSDIVLLNTCGLIRRQGGGYRVAQRAYNPQGRGNDKVYSRDGLPVRALP